jgi:hypothetical protein
VWSKQAGASRLHPNHSLRCDMGVLVITNRLHEASALGKHSERGEACTKTDPSGDGIGWRPRRTCQRSKALGDVVPLTVVSLQIGKDATCAITKRPTTMGSRRNVKGGPDGGLALLSRTEDRKTDGCVPPTARTGV